MIKKNIIWLASYPKSGNTWFRVFLTNLLQNSDSPASINDLSEASISSSRKIFDEYTGLSSSDLNFNEIDTLRPDVYRMQSEESDELLFKKVHDKYYEVENGEPLFPAEISKGVVYFIRNPLDVLVSFAYHSAKPIEKMIGTMNNSDFALCNTNGRLQNQLRQILGSWSDHVESWTGQGNIPVHIVRYEDMINHSFETFKNAVNFIGIETTDKNIADAIAKSDFSQLSKQEKEEGFKEKTFKSKAFFRKGAIGDWRNNLNKQEVKIMLDNNRDIMVKYKYLSTKNKPTF
jgi:Sulfotransferase domain